jgi:NAD-dependent dihydropyrimidine dehydrogenase PreA subunit
MASLVTSISNFINYLARYPKIGRFIGTIFGLLEVPILDFIHFIDKISPGSYQPLMKIFSTFYGSKIIPINTVIENKASVAPTEEILGIIKQMPAVSLGYCYCRSKYKNCDNPIWSCIHIGTAKHIKELGDKIPLKSSSIEEVEHLLNKANKLGLVHQLLTSPTPDYVYVICNCCHCCCVMLRNAIDFNLHGAALPSNFIVKHNSNKCKNCGDCTSSCYFGTLEFDKKLTINITQCVGCGLCITVCNNNALKLVRRLKKI